MPNHEMEKTEKMRELIERRIKSAPQCRINAMLEVELIDCSYEECTATVGFSVHEWMLNPVGLLHGGVMATFFDISMGVLAVYLNDDALTPTANLSVNFVRPVRSGERVLVKAQCHHSGRTMIQASASAYTAEHEAECAYATAIFSKSTPRA